MATDISTVLPTDWSVADMLGHISIPPERIRLYPPPGTATAEDVLAVRRRTGRLCELIDGVLVEKTVGYYESVLAMELAYYLRRYLEDHPLGTVGGPDGTLQVLPHQVRIPDVSFVRWEQYAGQGPSRDDPIPALAPDLAVEILSESNTAAEMERKLHDYFRGGSRLVWYLDPATRSARAYTAPTEYVAVHEGDVLDGGDVLPGFRLRLGDLFDRVDRRGRGC